jgi:hypothetical protein
MKRAASIGFDRRLRQEWLDAIASKRTAGATVPELRKFGHKLLRSDCPADEARGKTLTVLFHLWVDVPANAVALRDSASKMLADIEPRQRIALHWGLGLATYPFFRDIADATGRFLGLQDSVSLAQIQRRLAERWGQRSTTERAAQRIVRSWIDWGVLRESKQRGMYVTGKLIEVSGALASWVVEAVLVGADAESQTVAQVRRAHQLFPFCLKVSANELRRAPRLAVHRQGVDEDVVMLHRSASHADSQSAQCQLHLL